MRAMLLCAGLGTRLRPVTDLWPKPAVPFLGQPLLRYSLALLANANIREVGVNTHHLPEVMTSCARAETQRLSMALTVSHEAESILGTGGGIRQMKSFLCDDDFVVMAADVLSTIDLQPIIDRHRATRPIATMVLLPMPAGATYNAVEVDAGGLVKRIAGKGVGGDNLTRWHFSGIHIITPEIFDFMEPQRLIDINHDVYPRAISAGRQVRAHIVRDGEVYWSDLGTSESYLRTHRDVLSQQVKLQVFGQSSPMAHTVMTHDNTWRHPSARIGNIRATGPAFFAEDCVVGDDARIGALVSVGRGAKVGPGAWLNRTAVLDGAVVRSDALIEDSIVLPNGRVIQCGERRGP